MAESKIKEKYQAELLPASKLEHGFFWLNLFLSCVFFGLLTQQVIEDTTSSPNNITGPPEGLDVGSSWSFALIFLGLDYASLITLSGSRKIFTEDPNEFYSPRIKVSRTNYYLAPGCLPQERYSRLYDPDTDATYTMATSLLIETLVLSIFVAVFLDVNAKFETEPPATLVVAYMELIILLLKLGFNARSFAKLFCSSYWNLINVPTEVFWAGFPLWTYTVLTLPVSAVEQGYILYLVLSHAPLCPGSLSDATDTSLKIADFMA